MHNGNRVDLIVSDVSFISLKKILPAAFPLLKDGGDALVLIKPDVYKRQTQSCP